MSQLWIPNRSSPPECLFLGKVIERKVGIYHKTMYLINSMKNLLNNVSLWNRIIDSFFIFRAAFIVSFINIIFSFWLFISFLLHALRLMEPFILYSGSTSYALNCSESRIFVSAISPVHFLFVLSPSLNRPRTNFVCFSVS